MRLDRPLFPSMVLLISILFFLFFPSQSICQPAELVHLAVLDLQLGGNIPQNFQLPLSDRLRHELVSTGRYLVVERGQMENILKEQGFQLSGCTSTECAVEAGRLLGVQQMLAGSISKVGQTHMIILRLIDVETGVIVRTQNVDCMCTIDEVLSVRIREAARRITGLPVEASAPGRPVETATPAAGYGDVYIKTEPPGATVDVDGERRQGQTPLFLEQLSAGRHEIRLVKENLVGVESVFITPGQTEHLDITLMPGIASLIVLSEPFEAQVEVDGRGVGNTPLTLNSISAGAHRVRLLQAGYEPSVHDVIIAVGEQKRIEVSLIPIEGRLNVSSNIERGTLIVDGTANEVSFPIAHMLSAGTHTVEVRAPYHDPFTKTIAVNQSGDIPLHADLVRQRGILRLSGLPAGTRVFLDGELLGVTPMPDLQQDAGVYQIRLEKPGYEKGKQNAVAVQSGAATPLAFDLKQKTRQGAIWRSLVLPGWGQRYADRTRIGTAYTVTEVAALAFAVIAWNDYQGKTDTYTRARDAYDNADYGDNLLQLYDDRMAAYDDADAAKSTLTMVAGIAIAVYVWNVADVLLWGDPSGGGSSGQAAVPVSRNSAGEQSAGTYFGPSIMVDSRGSPVAGVSLSLQFGSRGGER